MEYIFYSKKFSYFSKKLVVMDAFKMEGINLFKIIRDTLVVVDSCSLFRCNLINYKNGFKELRVVFFNRWWLFRGGY